MNRAARPACVALCLIAFALLTGCWVPSVNALYGQGDTFYDDSLLGVWKADDGSSSMTFARNNDGTCYLITYEENDKPGTFEGCLTHIGNVTFLDITPADTPQAEAIKAHQLPLHSFWRLETGLDTFTVQSLDDRWFKDKAAKKRLGLASVKSGDDLVLTASTKALRNFFKRYGETDEVFSAKGTYHREK